VMNENLQFLGRVVEKALHLAEWNQGAMCCTEVVTVWSDQMKFVLGKRSKG